jgi:hypothetical protein
VQAARPRSCIKVHLKKTHSTRVRGKQESTPRAREKGVKLGRPRIDPKIESRVRQLRKKGFGILKFGRELGIGTSTVQRVVGPMSAQ